MTDVTLALHKASGVSTSVTTSREDEAAANRARMPEIAAFVDHLRSLFGPVTVRWAKENGFEVGERGPEGVPITPQQVVSLKGNKR